ncbi:hypothetical protein X975_23854, partial [Stegodyphus mimosarum]
MQRAIFLTKKTLERKIYQSGARPFFLQTLQFLMLGQIMKIIKI